METKERDYKEERFEFTVYVNDNIICKRNFRIYNFIENSMNTWEFKDKLDEIVRLIDDDLKSKSRVYSWYYFNPNAPEDNEEFTSPLIEPWACTFKIVISFSELLSGDTYIAKVIGVDSSVSPTIGT